LGYLEASFSLPLLFCLPVQEKPRLGRASGFSLAQETGNTPMVLVQTGQLDQVTGKQPEPTSQSSPPMDHSALG